MDEIVTTLKRHYELRNIFAECFQFHRRNQKQGESGAEFVAELRCLAAHCSFKTNYFEHTFRDWLVCGLTNKAIQKQLLTKCDITLAKVVEISVKLETA